MRHLRFGFYSKASAAADALRKPPSLHTEVTHSRPNASTIRSVPLARTGYSSSSGRLVGGNKSRMRGGAHKGELISVYPALRSCRLLRVVMRRSHSMRRTSVVASTLSLDQLYEREAAEPEQDPSVHRPLPDAPDTGQRNRVHSLGPAVATYTRNHYR